MKVWDKAVLIPIDDLVYCDWNANELPEPEMAALIEDIQHGSFDEPAQVVPADGGKFLVLGGEHRTKALRALDHTEVPCIVRQDLVGKTRKDLILWSVRRNNIRGRVNEQKYAKIEQELVEQHQMTTEAARRSMLINGDLAKALKRADKKNGQDKDEDQDDSPERGERGEQSDAHKETKDREGLLKSLKAAEQEVLLQSGDTVEHGYLFFAQDEKLHLVVNESSSLYGAVRRMVDACKGESATVDEFLISAISKELKSWE
jgi:ParB-like chromosome segregation protein Spo0J